MRTGQGSKTYYESLLPRSIAKRNLLVLSVCTILAPMILLVALFGWASSNSLEESVSGAGQFVPEGNIRVVMSPTQGIVSQIDVKKNDVVKAGDVLMTLEPEQPQIENQNFREQIALLQSESAALHAALNGGSHSKLPISSVQRAWLSATQQAYQASQSQVKEEIHEAEHALKESISDLKREESLLGSLGEQQKRYHQLYQEGGLPLVEVQNFDDKVTQSQGNVNRLRETCQARRAEINKLGRKPAELMGSYQRDLLVRLSEHEKSIAQLQSNQALTQVTLNRTIIRAPIDGIIHEQSIYGAGDVIASSSEKLFSIVPLNATLVAEVKVGNKDLSYIHLEQKAALQIEALPYQQFGKLSGKVIAISPSTIQDKDGHFVYLVRIKPNKTWLSDNRGHKRPLRTGMTLSADIITREKPILSFFTDPVQSQLDRAFRDPTTR